MRIVLAAVWAWAALGFSPAHADEARARAHGEAFVSAFNDGSLAAAETFIAQHGTQPGSAERLFEYFTRQHAEKGQIERAQVSVLSGGRTVFVTGRRSRSGAWETFQFRVDAAHEDRLQLFFVSMALEPYEPPAFGVDDPRFAAWMDGFVARLANTQPFYGVIGVQQHGRVVYERAFGLADVAQGAPNTLATRFNTASGAKMFTAVAVMQLIERGVLTLDTALTRYVPEAAGLPQADAITIRHLLSHSSGIGDYWDDAYEAAWGEIVSHDALLPHVLRNFGTPTLGTFAYSNSNFALLGLIIERASGQDFYRYVRTHVFAPAGMTATGYPIRAEARGAFALPYNAVINAGLVTIGEHDLVVLGARGSGAGGAATTLADMLAFDRALREGQLVSPQSFEQMRSMQAESEAPGHGYGFGLLLHGDSYGHEGSSRGAQFAFRHFEAADVTIVVASNFNTIAGPEIASALERIAAR